MQYLLLIYENEKRFSTGYDAGEMGEYMAFGKEFAAAIKGGNALQPSGTATTVRVRDGKRRSQHDKWWILVNRNYRGSRRIAAGTLLHECVHVEQRCMYSCGYNGHRFNRRMKELAARGALNGIW